MGNARARIGFGIANLFVAALAYACIFQLLPTRWLPVDVGGVVVVALMAASGIALVANRRSAGSLTRAAAFVVLALGLVTFAGVALTASWLHGVYGPVGRGGYAIFVLVAALVLPYVVVLPAAELLWLGPSRRPTEDPEPER